MTQVRDRKEVNRANRNEMCPGEMDSRYVCSLAILGAVCVFVRSAQRGGL